MAAIDVTIPNRPTVEITHQNVVIGTCADGSATNSDGSFTIAVPSGVDVPLPNINFTDSDGTTTSVPSVQDIVATACGATGGTLTIGVYSDAGHTTPITSADFGDTVYIKGVVTGITATRYYIYIDNGIVSRLPQDNVTGEFSYDVNLYGTINIVIIAVDASTGVAQSAPFELTVAELFPPDIAGCALWINADRLDTYTFNGVNVSQQDDLSGNSNNISAPASANEPLYLDTGAGLNGLRSVRYDGSEYQVASGLSLDIVSGNSIFIIVEFTASDTGGIISNGGNISDGSAYFFLQQLGLSVRTYGGGASYSSSYPVVVGTKYLFEIHRTTAQEVFLINGVEQHTRAIGTAGNRNNFYVNTSFGGNSSSIIADIDVHNAALTNAQKEDIRNYLTDKWAI